MTASKNSSIRSSKNGEARSAIPRPEHPLPQAQRKDWINLNGPWEFGESNHDHTDDFLGPEPYPDQIVVPFCRESSLSGLGRRELVKHVWYRRTFQIPKSWRGKRKRLHIGGSDWKTSVWLNGDRVGEHVGGGASFWFDITDMLQRGDNTLVIHVFDDMSSGLQALGKQSATGRSESIFYTPVTGIWQTVWLEAVGESYILDFHMEPSLHRSAIDISVNLKGLTAGLRLRVSTESEMGEAAVELEPLRWRDNRMSLALPGGRRWSPRDPFLYPVRFELCRGEEVVDAVESYTGLREINVEGAAVLINGEAIFQRLVLDQGYYPDGIWTAPTDEALRQDIELGQAAGFNGARLHQKVFEPRYHYWADRLGYLCWAEFPCYGANYNNAAVHDPIIREWIEIVSRDRNHPSIVGWCPFNETPPCANTIQRTVAELTRQLDPTRPCLETSGWTHCAEEPEILDAHDYDQNPVTFRQRLMNRLQADIGALLPDRYNVHALQGIPFFISEYGGIGWSLDEAAWGYGKTPRSLQEFYDRFAGLAAAQMEHPHVFGMCYTQLTDVEQEQNGLYNYDRTPKFDLGPVREVLTARAAYEEHPPTQPAPCRDIEWTVLVGSHHDRRDAKPWEYIEAIHPEEGMEWLVGYAPFGYKDPKWKSAFRSDQDAKIRTDWKGDSLRGRQRFHYDGRPFHHAVLVVHYDDLTGVALNGQELWNGSSWIDKYDAFDVTERARTLLREGENTIQFYVKQHEGTQFFDLALLLGTEMPANHDDEPEDRREPEPQDEASTQGATPSGAA
jgi:hypothetical protein